MGDQPTRKRQRFLLHLAGGLIGGLLGLVLVGCTTGFQRPADPSEIQAPARLAAWHLALGESRMLQGRYRAAQRECDLVLAEYPGWADDQALLLLGMVLIHPGNPEQDVPQAAVCFQRLVDRYPGSDGVAAARTWLAMIAQLDENQRIIKSLANTSAVLEKQLKTEKDKRLHLEERLQQMKAIDLTME